MAAPVVFTKDFWVDAAERGVKTVAQAVLALLTTNGTNVTHIDATSVLYAAILAGVISLLTSVVSAQATGTDSGSLVK